MPRPDEPGQSMTERSQTTQREGTPLQAMQREGTPLQAMQREGTPLQAMQRQAWEEKMIVAMRRHATPGVLTPVVAAPKVPSPSQGNMRHDAGPRDA
jgi:hypothetical protein